MKISDKANKIKRITKGDQRIGLCRYFDCMLPDPLAGRGDMVSKSCPTGREAELGRTPEQHPLAKFIAVH